MSQESQTKIMPEILGKLEVKKIVLGGSHDGEASHFNGFLECFQLYDTKLPLSTMKGLQFCPNRHGKLCLISFT